MSQLPRPARADGKIGARGWNGATVRLQFLPFGKNWQDSSYSANSLLFRPYKKSAPARSFSPVSHSRNWKLAAVPFYPKSAFFPASPLLACLRMQTGADCKFYYHFNDAILAVRAALTRLPWANVLKSCPTLRNWRRAAKPFYHKSAFFPPALHHLYGAIPRRLLLYYRKRNTG